MSAKQQQLSNKNEKEERSLPSAIEHEVLLIPPSYALLTSTLDKRANECRVLSSEEKVKLCQFVIDEQRRTSAISVACGQQFPRDCRSCGTESPSRRAVCSNRRCEGIVCSDCAETLDCCPHCENSSEFLRLYEEDSRECLICVETPFSRSAFSGCGHIVCTACSLQLIMDMGRGLCCPFCRVPSGAPLTMVENVVTPPPSIDNLCNLFTQLLVID